MEIPVFTSFQAVSNASLCPFISRQVWYGCFNRSRKYGLRWSRDPKPLVGIAMSKDSLPNGYDGREAGETKSGDLFGGPEIIEVIGIGSRKDAVLDFCLNSPFKLWSLRFWDILMKESGEVQLQLRSTQEEPHPRFVEAPLFMKSCSKDVVLVVSAGYGLDHTVAVGIFEGIKSANGLTVAVVLKPFSFEGLRRQDEVKALVGKLKDSTDLLIEIGIDSLLKKDLVTLDEAMKTANNAVLLAIIAISVLKSEKNRKFVDGVHDAMKEVGISEVTKMLENYKEARIGFGAAHNIKTSILRSMYDCPFLGDGLKDTNSIVICILASSVPVDDSDIVAFLHTFRQTTGYMREIIISSVYEPQLEPNLLITTVLTLGLNVQQSSQNGGILSRLAQHLPLVFSFWGRHHQRPVDDWKDGTVENLSPLEVMDSYDFDEEANKNAPDVLDDNNIEELDPVVSSKSMQLHDSRVSEQNEKELYDTLTDNAILCDAITEEGDSALQRENLINWNLGPGYELAREWAKERVADATPMVDNIGIIHLPVGVRPSEKVKDYLKASFRTQQHEPEIEIDVKKPVINQSTCSWNALRDAGLEAMKEFASTFSKANFADKLKKQGVLSVRAASMLEAERDLSKRWSPTMEMQYRGGLYRGRCQGGLPEGKGCLVLGDGNIYDGLWRYGKRSGPGTFYFKNGDVFQGFWRDDIMHGKGWYYFHTGDRWFANFWKGKANGEGRFYTKSGDAFFGNFKDGWRHGQFLCINACGTRYIEIWEHGILLDSKPLDKNVRG